MLAGEEGVILGALAIGGEQIAQFKEGKAQLIGGHSPRFEQVQAGRHLGHRQ